MIRTLSKKFVKYIASAETTKDEIEEMEYILNVYTFEFLKIAGLIILFSACGYFKEILTVIILFSTVRPYIGGYHETTQLRCFIVTLIITGFIIALSFNVDVNIYGEIILLIISIFAVYNQAPVLNPEMPISNEKNIRRNRVKGLTHFILWSILSVIIYKYLYIYSMIILWSLVVNALYMFNRKNINDKNSIFS